MGAFLSYGLILQVLAIIHFIRRRPSTFWLFVIVFLGGLGALIYILFEVLPDIALLQQSFAAFPRRKRIRHLETVILDNPSVGNYEELADLYLDDRKFERARDLFDRAIELRGCSEDAYYRRALARVELGDLARALPDIERVVAGDPKYDFYRAPGLLAHVYANVGRSGEADALFRKTTEVSTLSETYYNYAAFLLNEQRYDEAREWARRLLAKKATMPGYLRRRERPWFRKASALIKKLPKQAP
jgi:hypothetical protein